MAQQNDSILRVLDKELNKQHIYHNKKYNRISDLRENVEKNQFNDNQIELYDSYKQLYEEYRTFQYDSAYYYLERAKHIALFIADNNLVAETKLDEGFILLSAGLFKEAMDTLDNVNVGLLAPHNIYEYYTTKARAYYDLADYNNDRRFSIGYIRKGHNLLKEAIGYTNKGSQEFWAAEGLLNLKRQNWSNAKNDFETWLADYHLTPNQYSIATSSLSYIYAQSGDTDKATYYLALAAISDVRNSIRENIALRNLANILYEKRDLKRANNYVHHAMQDAVSYNARQRKIQISSILPIIESTLLDTVEKKNNNLRTIAILLSVLAVVALILLIIIIIQLRHKNEARKKLNEYNTKLKEMNVNLWETDAIKQDYITYFLKATSELINKLDTLQKSILLKVRTKKPEEVISVLKNYSVKKERNDMFRQFDEVFLKLFPSFITEFNNLFQEKERKELKKDELLNTELRIYALHRLGIRESQQVAEFLEISVATIYTYKTRIKSKSLFRENFDEKIMEIKRL